MGEQYALRVLDSLESGQDAQALANLHNNFAGRLVSSLNVRFHRIQNLIEFSFILLQAVRHSLQQSCKCHGVSGSCTMQTCWMQLPSFRAVGQSVKRQYDSAVR
jgi:wingless-type MMTV integration site family, member 8